MLESLSKRNELQKAIIQTLAFFDIFDYPLTSWEAWKYLYGKRAEYTETFFQLQELLREEKICEEQGMYFFPGRENISDMRRKRYNFAETKYKRALFAARLISFVPFVRNICVCNSLSYSNASPESDIDFFIVTEKKRIWTVRFFSIALMKLFRLRISQEVKQDKICLSFFLASDSFHLKQIALPENDTYLLYWISLLSPLYDEADTLRNFWNTNSSLLLGLPNAFPKSLSPRRTLRRASVRFILKQGIEKLLRGNLGNALENFLRGIQRKIMPKPLLELAKTSPSHVVISDSILKFHSNDRRRLFQEQWERGFKQYEKTQELS